MSITMGQLASRFARASQDLPQITQKAVRTVAKVGEGLMKQEIQAVHAVDTGTMLNSTTVELIGKDTALIGPNVSGGR